MPRLIFILLLFCLTVKGNAQNFALLLGESGDEDGYHIEQTTDGGYIIVGTTTSTAFGAANEDIYVVKLDDQGQEEWSRIYSGPNNEKGTWIQQTQPDGGYIVMGHTDSYGAGGDDFILIKIENDGDVTWANAYGTAARNETSGMVQQTDDNSDGIKDDGFIMIGNSKTAFVAAHHVYKVSNTGAAEWGQNTGSSTTNQSNGFIQQTNDDADNFQDDGFITVTSLGISPTGLRITKYTPSGLISWRAIYPSGAGLGVFYPCRSIKQTDDDQDGLANDGYILAGYSSANIFLMKITEAAGTLTWARTYDGGQTEQGYDVLQTDDDGDGKKDDGFLIFGSINSTNFSNGGVDYCLVKTESDGTYNWIKTYGGITNDNPLGFSATSEKGYVMTGRSNSAGSGGFDAYVVKTDSLGNTDDMCGVNIPLSPLTSSTVNIGGSFSTPLPTTQTYSVTPILTLNAIDALSTITPPCLSADFINTTVCQGNATLFTAISDGTPSSWSWLFGDGNGTSILPDPSYTYSTSGSYSVSLNLSNGSFSSAVTKPVMVYARPTLSASGGLSFCAEALGFLEVSDFGGGATTYEWSPAIYLLSTTGSTPNGIFTNAGSYTYSVIGTNLNACKDTVAISVSILPLPTAVVSVPVSICPGIASNLSAQGGESYLWLPSSGLSSSDQQNITATLNTPGLYTYSLITTYTILGCSDTTSTSIFVYTQPTVSSSDDLTLCLGDIATLSASGGIDYAWQPANNISSTMGSNITFTASDAGTIDYSIIVADVNSCKDTTTLSVTILPNVTANAGNDITICNGDIATLSGSGGTDFLWSPGGSNSSNPNESPSLTSVYTLTVTAGSCSDTDQVIVIVNELPIIVSTSYSICSGNSTTLSASSTSGGTVTYTWSPSTNLDDSTIYNPTANPSSSTNYTVTGTDANGCKNTTVSSVTIIPAPNIDAGTDITITIGKSTTLNATGGVSYSWSPDLYLSDTGIFNPVANPETTIVYIVTGEDSNGCTDSSSVTVTVVVPCSEPFIPNAFSPNNDGENDVFAVRINPTCTTGILDFSLKIFNRWGNAVFESEDITKAWDGKWKGKELDTGLFVYNLSYKDVYGEKQRKDGNITLVR